MIEYLNNIAQFLKLRVLQKIFEGYTATASIWCDNMLNILDIICSSKLTVFLELHSRNPVCFLEQILCLWTNMQAY